MVRPDDFACRCGHWQRRRCDLIMAWALDFLKCDKTTLLSHAVYTLTNWDASIGDLYADQWGIIQASVYPKSKREQFATAIQCDTFEDGVAFTVKAFYDKFGDPVEK